MFRKNSNDHLISLPPKLTRPLPSSCQRNVSAADGDDSVLDPDPRPRTVMSD